MGQNLTTEENQVTIREKQTFIQVSSLKNILGFLSHLVTTNRNEGSLEEDAELGQRAGGKGVTLDVPCSLGGTQVEETHKM